MNKFTLLVNSEIWNTLLRLEELNILDILYYKHNSFEETYVEFTIKKPFEYKIIELLYKINCE